MAQICGRSRASGAERRPAQRLLCRHQHGRFAADHIEPGSVLITDGWRSYPAVAASGGYGHKPTTVLGSGRPAHVPLPGVHRVSSLVKRWLLGTH